MPAPSDILAGLAAIATGLEPIAALWHLTLLVSLSALAFGWRPSRRTAMALLAALPASVSACAFLYGNPFNGVAFAGLAAGGLFSSGKRLRALASRADPMPTRLIGAGLLTLGWVYPHFLGAPSVMAYVLAAPTGLLPCPTLAVLVGFVLWRRDLFPARWALALATYGTFYGAFGVLRLGVWIDAGLVLGTACLWRSIVLGVLHPD